jgi:alpha-mannosidase
MKFPAPTEVLCTHAGASRWAAAVLLCLVPALNLAAAGYTRLVPLPAPRITGATDAIVLTGSNPVENLIDGNPKTEFASAGRGLETFVEFDFGAPTRIAGFRHQDRKNGTIAGSELTFFDAAGREVRRVQVTHPDRSGAVTFERIWPAVEARRVRWQVTKLGVGNAGAVGGAEIGFYGVGPSESSPAAITLDPVALPEATAPREGAALQQPLKVTVDYPYAEPIDGTLQLGDEPPRAVHLAAGPHTVEFSIPTAKADRRMALVIRDQAQAVLVRSEFTVPAFRELTIYVLPHSHVDIGYTEVQTAIEEKQLNNLLAGIAAARRTASYPEGARFVWNLEGLWAADLLLHRLDAAQREDFFAAVRQGQVALNGLYFNTLTGLCRPEELTRLFRFGTELRAQTGAPMEAAMISDVPGYTWGTVTAMAQAGIRYFCAAPNIFDRIGDTYVQWENKPFWWIGPSGHDRVLVWVPFGGYNLAARIGRLSPEWVAGFTEELVRSHYAYDVVYMRWSRGDNAAPDPAISDQVRDWNATHAWPRFVISSARDAFRALEQKHGAQLPEFRGDWTPYWEDGAGSSALETAMNRNSSDRLAQAEALWALQSPATYPVRDFAEAMGQLLRYDEHTWGASSSVTAPTGPPAIEQWSIKSSYATSADERSRDLLMRSLALAAGGDTAASAIDVFNANSWTRSGLAILTRDMAAAGDAVTDDTGAPVASQRLTNGELAIFARDVPAFSSRRYTIAKGAASSEQRVIMTKTSLDNGLVKVSVDPQTGGIVELRSKGIAMNLAGTAAGTALNEYLYFNGDDPTKARSNGPVRIRVGEKGPLVASLVVESDAPGCFALTREIKLVAGEDAVELANQVDKQRLVAASYRAPEGKESVNFAFPFNVPDGQVRLEVPFGVVRPDIDQIPGACKNWFTVDRWADVSNGEFGVTWISLDTPLVEVGGLTANLLNSQTNPAVWRKQVGPTQKLYAWVMNNHWGTNYRAFQEGPVTFRFVLRPHGSYQPADASRAAIAASQPLLAARAHGQRPIAAPRFTIDSPDVIVTGLKPGDDGHGVIVRLWNASAKDVQTRVHWSAPVPRRVSVSDTSEQAGRTVDDAFEIPAWGAFTLRADLP